MKKEEMKKIIDDHIEKSTAMKGKIQGNRAAAWQEVKALEILVKAARG